MTYRQLICRLRELDSEQLDQDVTIYKMDNDEFHPLNISGGEYTIADENQDILDIGHPYLII